MPYEYWENELYYSYRPLLKKYYIKKYNKYSYSQIRSKINNINNKKYDIEIEPLLGTLNFKIVNKTDNVIKLDLNQSVITAQYHNDTKIYTVWIDGKYIDRDQVKSYIIIPSGIEYNNQLSPVETYEYVTSYEKKELYRMIGFSSNGYGKEVWMNENIFIPHSVNVKYKYSVTFALKIDGKEYFEKIDFTTWLDTNNLTKEEIEELNS